MLLICGIFVFLPEANPTIYWGLTLQGAHQQGEAQREQQDVSKEQQKVGKSTQDPSHKTGLYYKCRLGGAASRIPGNGVSI